MTPRDGAITTYAERERAMRAEAKRMDAMGDRDGAREVRQYGVICHRAMTVEILDPPPIDVKRRG